MQAKPQLYALRCSIRCHKLQSTVVRAKAVCKLVTMRKEQQIVVTNSVCELFMLFAGVEQHVEINWTTDFQVSQSKGWIQIGLNVLR